MRYSLYIKFPISDVFTNIYECQLQKEMQIAINLLPNWDFYVYDWLKDEKEEFTFKEQ